MMKLIQGFFFQPRVSAAVKIDMLFEDLSIPIQSEMFQFMYAGIIFPNPENKEELIGEMMDCFGESKLSNIIVNENEVCFVKRYDNRNDVIGYQFMLEGNLWIGKYSGNLTGKGHATCIITDAPDKLVSYPE